MTDELTGDERDLWRHWHHQYERMAARCEQAEAEVAQLRQERDHLHAKLKNWINGEDRLVEVLGPRDCDIIQRIQQLVAVEAARDHLRARLGELVDRWQARSSSASAKCAADLLAVLTEPPQDDTTKHDDATALET